MPNWCSNTARITAPEPVIQELRARIEATQCPSGSVMPGILDLMVPEPRDIGDGWYDWRVANWGTKWEISHIDVLDESEPDAIELGFESAWAPPLEAFRAWAERDGRVTYRIDYIEEGVGFVGRETYDGERWDEQHFDQGDDPDGFETWARAEWGWEPWEDPEPLTEWLKNGIEAKKQQDEDSPREFS